jgi:hypothetical protein
MEIERFTSHLFGFDEMRARAREKVRDLYAPRAVRPG